MKKATNIDEFANNLDPWHELTPEDKGVYIPIYESILEKLRNRILNDHPESQTFYVAGQSGTGKSTALNFFKTDSLEAQYDIKYINMDEFLETNDVDIIDFLLAFAYALVKGTKLENTYYKKLEELKKIKGGERQKVTERISEKVSGIEEKAEASIGGGFFNFVKMKAGLFQNFKLDRIYRETIRDEFKLKKPFLSQLVNDVIDKYIEKISKGKKLLVIIDDLDKLEKVEQINSIFIENSNYIYRLKCKKVISIPTYLTKAPKIFNSSQSSFRRFVLRLSPNPFEKGERIEASKSGEDKKIKNNRQLLRDLVLKRIKEGCSLIDSNALEEAINYSGGIIRQLVRILSEAAVQVRTMEGKRIRIDDVKDAIGELRNVMASPISSSEDIKLLHIIDEKKVPDSESSHKFIELLHGSYVLAYENGEPWYEVNPLIRETVKVYAKRLGK